MRKSGWFRESRRHSLASRGIKSAQRTRYTTSTMRNLNMNPEVYQLRRQVIDIIYEAKNYVDLPRINVRITENPKEKRILGQASMDGTIVIWIPQKVTETESKENLRYIVLHEIAHTAYGLRHNDKGLMSPHIKEGISKDEAYKLFLDAIKNKGESQ